MASPLTARRWGVLIGLVDLATALGFASDCWQPSKAGGRLLLFLVAWCVLSIACLRGSPAALGLRRTAGALGAIAIGVALAAGVSPVRSPSAQPWFFASIAVLALGAIAAQVALGALRREE